MRVQIVVLQVVLVPTLLEMGLIAYMFLREFREAIR